MASFAVCFMYSVVDFRMALPGLSLERSQFKESSRFAVNTSKNMPLGERA